MLFSVWFFDYDLFPSTVEYAFLKHFISQAVLETVARVGRVKFKKNETNEEKYAMLSLDSLYAMLLPWRLLSENEKA